MVGWLSPVATTAEISAHVVRAHTACGNGISWALDVRRGSSRRRLASGTSDQQKEPIAGPFENVNIRPGDLVSLAIGPRDANHACDLTEIDLTVKATDGSGRVWQLAPDISPDVLAGNPHADRFGNKAVWHFYTEPTSGEVLFAPLIPADSVLARWRDAKEPNEKKQLTEEVAKLLSGPRPGPGDEPDKLLYRQATSLIGPVMGMIASAVRTQPADSLVVPAQPSADNAPRWGIDPALFGKKPDGSPAEPNYLVVQAPSILTVRIPAELVAGSEFVVTATLDPASAPREAFSRRSPWRPPIPYRSFCRAYQS